MDALTALVLQYVERADAYIARSIDVNTRFAALEAKDVDTMAKIAALEGVVQAAIARIPG
jgi:hypothetical protein